MESYKLLIPFVAVAAIAGCGGGGSNGTSPEPIGHSSSSSSVSSSSSSISSSASSSMPIAVEPLTQNLYSEVDFPVGIAVNAGNETNSLLKFDAQQATVKQHFNQITAGNIMKMSYLHPSEQSFTFGNADALVSWAESNGIGVHGHVLIWHSDYQVPGFMKNYTGDFQAMLDNHVTTIADHYKGKLDSWDVVNEALRDPGDADNCYRDSVFFQKLGRDFIANAFIKAREADPDVELYYNDFNNEGSNAAKLQCMLDMVDWLLEEDVPITGVGFQMHVQIDWPSAEDISKAFKAIVGRGLKVKVTELDVPVNNPYGSSPFPQYTEYNEEAQQKHKARYKSIAEAYLDTVPAAQRGGFSVWGLWDSDSWLLTFSNRQGHADWPLLFTSEPEAGQSDANGPFLPKAPFNGVAEAFLGQ